MLVKRIWTRWRTRLDEVVNALCMHVHNTLHLSGTVLLLIYIKDHSIMCTVQRHYSFTIIQYSTKNSSDTQEIALCPGTLHKCFNCYCCTY